MRGSLTTAGGGDTTAPPTLLSFPSNPRATAFPTPSTHLYFDCHLILTLHLSPALLGIPTLAPLSPENDTIYWVDMGLSTISRAKRDQTWREDVVTNGIGRVEGIAVDWIAGEP